MKSFPRIPPPQFSGERRKEIYERLLSFYQKVYLEHLEEMHREGEAAGELASGAFESLGPERARKVDNLGRAFHNAARDMMQLDELAGGTERAWLDSWLDAMVEVQGEEILLWEARRIEFERWPVVERSVLAHQEEHGWTVPGLDTAYLLYVAREYAYDHYSSEEIFEFLAREIDVKVRTKDAAFMERFGRLMRQVQRGEVRRSTEQWLHRLWLPLALWECEQRNGGTGRGAARTRIENAMRVFGLHEETDVVKLLERATFNNAWRNRNRDRSRRGCLKPGSEFE